jgi:hypothetical protein
MSNDAISDTVIDHALGKKENLEVACLIHANFAEVKKRVISRFLGTLQEQLRKSLGDEWKVEKNGLANDIKRGEFSVFKDGWAGRCAVVLSQRAEKGFYVGWHKYEPQLSQFTALEQELKIPLERAEYAPNWGFWQLVAEKYWGWDETAPQSLIEMHFGDAVSYFRERILEWTGPLAPLIDRALRSEI